MQRTFKLFQNQRGFGLIETVVALFVLAIGLLGLAGLTSNSVKQNQVAYGYSQAMFLAQDLAERAMTNRSKLSLYQITFASDGDNSKTTTTCISGACTASDLAQWDVKIWKTAVKDRLPSGNGRVVLDDTGGKQELQITIQWSDRDIPLDANQDLDPDSATLQELVYKVEL